MRVGRVSGKASTPRKRRLSLKRPSVPWKTKHGCMRWWEPPRVSEINQMVFSLSAAKSDWCGSQSSDLGSRFVCG